MKMSRFDLPILFDSGYMGVCWKTSGSWRYSFMKKDVDLRACQKSIDEMKREARDKAARVLTILT